MPVLSCQLFPDPEAGPPVSSAAAVGRGSQHWDWVRRARGLARWLAEAGSRLGLRRWVEGNALYMGTRGGLGRTITYGRGRGGVGVKPQGRPAQAIFPRRRGEEIKVTGYR